MKSNSNPAVPVPANTAPSVLGARPSPPKAAGSIAGHAGSSARHGLHACAAPGSAATST